MKSELKLTVKSLILLKIINETQACVIQKVLEGYRITISVTICLKYNCNIHAMYNAFQAV